MFLALAHKSAAYRVGPCCAKTVQFKSERRMSAGIEDESEAKGILDAATLRRYSYEVSSGEQGTNHGAVFCFVALLSFAI